MRAITCWPILILTAAPLVTGEEIAIPACNLSASSNYRAPVYAQSSELTQVQAADGYLQWTVELTEGTYYLHVLYASEQRRPCRLTVNEDRYPRDVLGNVTGGATREYLQWETIGPLTLIGGPNVFGIGASGRSTPRLRGLYISPSETPPNKDVFQENHHDRAALIRSLNIDGLRQAINHLQEEYGARYQRSRSYLARLEWIERKLRLCLEPEGTASRSLDELTDELERLRHRALVADNPLLDFDELLFAKRYTYQSSHYYTDFIDGCKHFGGNLCVLSLADGEVRELAPDLKDGIFGRFDLSFDGQRVVFDYKARKDAGFRIYEVGIHGDDLRPLTFDPPDEPQRVERYWHRRGSCYPGLAHDPYTADLYWYKHYTDDMHPCYLPDGGICFISTRCERGILCDRFDFLTATTLYRMDADGANMEVLSESPVSEASPTVANDGRILYTRWEYVDKGIVGAKSLWVMHPDGGGSAEIFGNDIARPPTLLSGRPVPGSNNLFVALGTSHWAVTGVGTIVRMDINHPIRTRRPMTYITPDIDMFRDEGFHHNRNGQWVRDDKGPLFADPYPLSDKFFLVAHNPDRDWKDVSAYGLYLLDEFGNRVPIYRDSEISCWQPVPLRARPKPPVIPTEQPSRKQEATVVMSDVYQGLDGISRGTVKYLRIMETVPRPWAARRYWQGDTDGTVQHVAISKNTHLHVKVLHGIVPVAEDGSAHFTVPTDKNLFFQALDENYMEVQRMRTFVNFRPGETRSCVGCHELRQQAPANKMPLALRRPPSKPGPQPGETAPRPIYYPVDVQPVFDRHCVECHNQKKRDGNLDLSGDMTKLFNRSYEDILKRGDLVKAVPELAGLRNIAPVPPRSLGSHASKLIGVLRDGHEDVNLSQEEFIKLVTWVDANAPYYGSYFGRRNLKYRSHSNFRPIPTFESASGIPPLDFDSR